MSTVFVIDPVFRHLGSLSRCDERYLGVIENRKLVLPISSDQHPQARARYVVADSIPKCFQNLHLVIPSDQAGMNHEQMLPPLNQVLDDLGSRLSNQVQQVLPVLAEWLRTICLFDDGPIDFEFFRFFTQGIEQQLIE